MPGVIHTTAATGVDSADGRISKNAWNEQHAVDFGEAGDIAAETFGATAAAGATGEIADAGHIHPMPADPVTAHEAAGNPHAIYETSAEAQAKVDAHAAASNPHPTYLTAAEGDAAYDPIGAAAAAQAASQPADADIPTVSASQAEMETGTEIALRSMSPLRIAQAIAALGVSPGTELDYVEYTATVNCTATTEATANVIVTSNAVTYNGSTTVLIEFGADYVQVPADGVIGRIWLYEKVGAGAAASIGELVVVNGDGGTSSGVIRWPVLIRRRHTPSSASIIYSVRGSVASGTMSVDGGAGGAGNAFPGYLRITTK